MRVGDKALDNFYHVESIFQNFMLSKLSRPEEKKFSSASPGFWLASFYLSSHLTTAVASNFLAGIANR